MSVELEKARQQLAEGNAKKAVQALWLVEARARENYHEAQGLVEIAKQLSESSEGKFQKDAELLLQYGEHYMAKLSGRAQALAEALVPVRFLTFVGGHGYPLEVRTSYEVVFTPDALRFVRHGEKIVVEESLAEVEDIDVTGSVRQTGGGFAGGGFGVTGAVEGMAIAGVLNALSARTNINTVVRIQTRAGEMFFHTDSVTADALRMELSPIFTRLRGRDQPQSNSSGDTIERLSKLADLLDRGAISAEEFAKLKAELLSS